MGSRDYQLFTPLFFFDIEGESLSSPQTDLAWK
jgi:hypothetical protein